MRAMFKSGVAVVGFAITAMGCASPDMQEGVDLLSPTTVRIALFAGDGPVQDATDLRAWPAWFVTTDDVESLVVVPSQFNFSTRAFKDVDYPAADIDFGTPPAEALTAGAGLPVVLIVDVNADPTQLATLGDLPANDPLGISSYLQFADGKLNIETADSDTGAPSSFLAVPVATVAGYAEEAPSLTTMPLR